MVSLVQRWQCRGKTQREKCDIVVWRKRQRRRLPALEFSCNFCMWYDGRRDYYDMEIALRYTLCEVKEWKRDEREKRKYGFMVTEKRYYATCSSGDLHMKSGNGGGGGGGVEKKFYIAGALLPTDTRSFVHVFLLYWMNRESGIVEEWVRVRGFIIFSSSNMFSISRSPFWCICYIVIGFGILYEEKT